MPITDLMTRATMSEDPDPTTVEYDFITGEVPRYNFKDPVGLNLIKQQVIFQVSSYHRAIHNGKYCVTKYAVDETLRKLTCFSAIFRFQLY